MFVVSDGHWTDTSSLMSSAQVHSDSTRIFTLGVGSVPAFLIITDLYSAFRSEDTEVLDAAQED